jgi:SH3-like domain-containing protein
VTLRSRLKRCGAWLGTAALLCLADGAAMAQPQDLAPYLHQKPAHPVPAAKPKPKPVVRTTKPKAVPVITPRHPGPPRRPLRPTAQHLTSHKAVAVEEPPKPAPKKPAPPPVPANIGTNTGLPLPRYAALKSDDVNMRSGPGERYPVLWTYKRRDLPVKIEREFDIWRLVEDMDGIKGWMQAGFLTGRRSFVITGTDDRTLRADPNETADAVATLKPGVVGRIKVCEAGKAWCQMQVQDYRGWLKRSDVWGVDSDDVIAP